MKKILLLLISSILAKPIYFFSDAVQENRFMNNLKQYRCLVCQNESLFDSNAALALDLRQEIYQQIKNGKSDADIKNFLVSRYGAFIELNPQFSHHTSILWLCPIFILCLWLFRLFSLS